MVGIFASSPNTNTTINHTPRPMKLRPLILAALAAAPFASASTGPLKEKALALVVSNKDSVVQLSATVEIEMTAGDLPTKKEERKLETSGCIISKDGLIVVPLSTLDLAAAGLADAADRAHDGVRDGDDRPGASANATRTGRDDAGANGV